MKYAPPLVLVLLVAMLAGCSTTAPQDSAAAAATELPKPRVIVTTDPELDDLNSLIRYLLYRNELPTEGLIYASSGFHWKGDGKGTK